MHNLEKIGHGAVKVFTKLGDIGKVNASCAVIIELGQHVAANTCRATDIDDADAPLTHKTG